MDIMRAEYICEILYTGVKHNFILKTDPLHIEESYISHSYLIFQQNKITSINILAPDKSNLTSLLKLA